MSLRAGAKFLRISATFLAGLLLSAPALELAHNSMHEHSLCAEHPGEWVESHEAHENHEANKDFAEFAANAKSDSDHVACAWIAARERSQGDAKAVSPSLRSLEIPAAASFASFVFAISLPRFRLAPKNSPPRFS